MRTSLRYNALVMIVAAMLTALAGYRPAHAAPVGQPGLVAEQCPSVAGVFVPGTWETTTDADERSPRGLLAPVAIELERQFGDQFDATFIAYAAKAMDGMLYGDSEAQAVSTLKSTLRDFATRCRATKFLIAGYSQGADAAGDVASDIGCNQDPILPSKVLAVGLIADPKQGTQGGKLVGTQVSGTGIRGTRTQGFCQLAAVTAQICEPNDRYCATDSATNPVLSALAKVITQPGSTTESTTSTTSQQSTTTDAGSAAQSQSLTQSLDAGFSAKDLTGLPAAVTRIVEAARTGDTTELTSDLGSVANTLQKLSQLGTWVDSNSSAQKQLSGESSDVNGTAATQVLTAVKNLDLNAVGTALDTLVQGAGLTSTDSSVVAAANTLESLTSSLTSQSDSVLTGAASLLSLIKPSTVVGQITTVASGVIDFATNVPDVLDTLRQIGTAAIDPATDLPTKVRAVHALFGTLNNLCQPLVEMAAGVNLGFVAGLVGLIPDTSGVAQIASVVLSVLSNLDVVDLALQVGQLQEDLWRIVETITGGGDLVAVASSFAALVPTLLGFATIALDTLTGSGTKTDTSALDTIKTTTGGASDLAGLSSLLTNTAVAEGADDLSTLVGDGLTAIEFFASGAHQSYDSYVVDSKGTTALQWLAQWFANRIRQVGIGA